MQITDRIKNCNGCGACIVGCREYCMKMEKDADGRMKPVIDENGCKLCNNCVLYCPLYNPVEMPGFTNYYEYSEDYYYRDMPKVYRETLRQAKSGQTVEFAGTLCQIAGLISLMGNRLKPNVKLYPLHCNPDHPHRPECAECEFVRR